MKESIEARRKREIPLEDGVNNRIHNGQFPPPIVTEYASANQEQRAAMRLADEFAVAVRAALK